MSKKYKASNWVPNYPMHAIKRNINVVIPIRLQYTKFIDFVRVTEEQLKRIFHPVSITQCRVASINTCKNNSCHQPDDFYRYDFSIFFKRIKFLEKIVDMADKRKNHS